MQPAVSVEYTWAPSSSKRCWICPFLEVWKGFLLTVAAQSLWTESKPTSVRGNSLPSSNRCEVFIQVRNRVITRRSEGGKFLSQTLKYVASCIYGLLVRLWSALHRLKRKLYQRTMWALTTKVSTTSFFFLIFVVQDSTIDLFLFDFPLEHA